MSQTLLSSETSLTSGTSLTPDSGAQQIWHEPVYFEQFRCAGAECEDTCCEGWTIGVDRETHDKYQKVSDPKIAPKLQQFVTISAANSGKPFATITLKDARCPFLTDNLCGVQTELGEDYLSQACATFPRVANEVVGAIERSLDLSCPEAARIALLNPERDIFREIATPGGLPERRLLEVLTRRGARQLPEYCDEVRSFAIFILQNRSYSIAHRMLLLGHFSAKLNELAEGAKYQTRETVGGFRLAMEARLFDEHLKQTSADPTSQLAIVLELVVGRVGLDYTSPRYRQLYGEFIQGIELRSDSTIFELGERYSDAYFGYFAPFMEMREYILEHYLVSYAYKNLFPFGNGSIANQYMIMASYFAATRALAVGLAGFYRSSFNEEHVVRAVQVCSRALEHCTSYPARALEILASKGITGPAGMAVLTQNLTQPARARDGYVTRNMKATA